MNEEDFKKNFRDKFDKKYPNKGQASLNIFWAYYDLLMIKKLYEETKQKIGDRDISTCVENNRKSEALEIHRLSRILVLCLKTMYIFADTFINILLKHAYNIPYYTENGSINKMSYRNFINTIVKKDNIDFKINEELKLKVYCMCVYRHKLIIHHDYSRLNANLNLSENDVRLRPFPENLSLNINCTKKIDELKEKYKTQISSLSGISDHYLLLNILYYTIPIYDKCNRRTIDELVEQNGCESYTIYEIMDIIDQFIIEVGKVL